MARAMASDRYIARGRLRSGSFTSPPTAAIRSKPCRAMKVYPMACTTPTGPAARKGSSLPRSSAGDLPIQARAPATIRIANTITLPIVAVCPPPPARCTSVTA